MHAPSLTALLVILAIVVLIFGTKKLRNMGGDLGAAIRNFKSSMKDGEREQRGEAPPESAARSSSDDDAGTPPRA